MASKRRKKWRGRVRTPDGGREVATFDKKADAVSFERSRTVDMHRGDWIDPSLGETSLSEYADRYLATNVGVRPSTLSNIESRLRLHILPAFGDTAIAAIRTSDVRAWRASLVERMSAESTNKAVAVLRQVLRLAVEDNAVRRNVCDTIEPLPQTKPKEIHPVSLDVIARLAGAIDERYRGPVIFCALTGLRPSELWAVRVSAVNFLKKSVRITEGADDRTGVVKIGELKTEKSRRTVRLDDETVRVLAQHLENYPSDSFLFTDEDGGPVSHRAVTRSAANGRKPGPWRDAVAALGGELLARFRFYDLRHSHASLLIDRGARQEQVRDRLGHGSIRTTYDWYGHLFPGHDDAMLADLGGLAKEAFRERDPHQGLSVPVRR